jgi:DNA-binding CsgD family transcriptional regulator
MGTRGPLLRVVQSCHGCELLASTYYTAQNDTGFHYRCVVAERDIGDDATTPEWCPEWRAARLSASTSAMRSVRSSTSAPFASSEDFFSWALGVLRGAGDLNDAETRMTAQLMLGRQYADVAAMLGCSKETVRWYAKKLLRKLDAASMSELLLVIGRALDERKDE